MTASAALEIYAARLDTMRRGCEYFVCPRASETRFLLHGSSLNAFTWKHEGNKHNLAPALFVSRQTGKSIAAISEFFYSEFQEDDSMPLHVEQAQARQTVAFQ